MMKTANATEATAGGKKYYKGALGSFHLPSGRMLVFCPSETTMTELLKKDAKVTVSEEMKSLVGKSGGDIWNARTSTGAFGGIGFAAPKSAYGGGRIFGNQMKMSQTLIFADENAAKQAETQMKLGAQQIQAGLGKSKKYESLDVSQSGATITISVTGNIEDDASFIFGGL